MQKISLVVFFLAVLVIGVLGTETRLLFFWPGGLLLGLAGMLAVLKWRLRISFPPSDACLLTAMLLALFIGSRAYTSPVGDWAREDVMTLGGCLVAYFLALTVAGHPSVRMRLLYVFVALAAVNLALGMVHFSGHWEFHLLPGFARNFQVGRIGGLFNNPNHLAAFFSMVIFLMAGWMCFGRIGSALRLFLGFTILALATGTALTVSRGALGGGAVGVVVFMLLALWLVWKTQRHLFKWLLLGGGVVLLLAAAVLFKVNEEAMQRRSAGSPVAEDVRGRIWTAAVAQYREAPLFGAGARMFYSGCIQHRDPRMQGWERDALFAHNEYLQILADYGWVGLALLVMMIAAHGWHGIAFIRWYASSKFPRTGSLASATLSLTMGALAALTASLLHAGVEFQWHVPAVAVTGAVLLGFLASPGMDADAPGRLGIPGVRTGFKLMILAVSSLLIYGAVTWGAADYHVSLANAASKKGDKAASLEHLLRAAEVDPKSGSIHYQLGLAYLDSWSPKKSTGERKRLLDAAVASLQLACDLNAFSHLYPLALADALDASGRHEEALRSIHRAISLAPLHEEPRLALGKHFHNLRDFEKAESAYLWAREAGAMNPAGTANWLSYYEPLLRDTAYLAELARKQAGTAVE